MGGGSESAVALGNGMRRALRSRCSVALWGTTGRELRAAVESIIESSFCLGLPADRILRARVDPAALPEARTAALDVLFERALHEHSGPRLVLVDEPDADLTFPDAVPVVDHMLAKAGEAGMALLYTTKRVGQAVAAQYAFRISRGGLRRIL